ISEAVRGRLRWFGTIQDVTAEKQAAEALASSESRYRTTFEQAAVGIVHTSLEGEIQMANQTFCEMCGLGRAEAIQRHIRDVTHPEDFARSVKDRAKILEGGGRPYQRELRLLRKDGSHTWVSVTTSAVRDRTGAPQHFVSVLSDISERKRVEAALVEGERNYRSLFEANPHPMWMYDLETFRFVAVNDAAIAHYGYARAEFLGMTIADIRPASEVQRLLESGARELRTGAENSGTWLHRRKDGSLIEVEVTSHVSEFAGRRVKVVLAHDVTERNAAEGEVRRFQAAMDVTPDSIYLTDPETMRFLYVNDTACKRLGYTRTELMRKTSYEVVGKTRAQIEPEYAAVVAAGEQGMSSESRFVRKDGSDGWTELHRRALRIDGKTLIVTIGRDITDRKRALQRLADSEARFRSLTQLSSDWYWEQDAEFRFTVFTGGDRAAKWGDDQDEQVGKRRWELAGITPLGASWEAHRALLEAHQPFRDFEYMRAASDGSVRYVSASGEPMFDAEGRFLGYRGTARDITARKQGEEDLRRFRLAMDGSPDIIIITDRATMRHLDVNESACRLLGYTRAELLAMGPSDVLPATRTELETKYDELIANPEQPSGMRSYYRCKDGSRLPFESNRRLLRAGERWIVVAISRDIRERIAAENALRESEERFRSLTGLSSDFYWESDAEHRLLRVTHGPQHKPVMGGSQIGKPRWESPSTHPDAAGWAAHRATLEARQPFRDFEVARIDSKGVERWLSISGEPVSDGAGAFKGYRGVGKDISERKLAEKRINRLNRVYAVLSGINAAIVRTRDRGELLREACRIAVELGGFGIAQMLHYEPATYEVIPVAAAGIDPHIARRAVIRPGAETISPRGTTIQAIRTRKPVYCNDLVADPEIGSMRRAAIERGYGSILSLPIVVGDEVSEVLLLCARDKNFFNDEELRLLEELAGDVAFALDHIAKEDKLNYLALYDPLTGLANRALLVDRLGQSIQTAGQAGAKFALALLDIERLTTINESLGRQAGDALIRQVGERLARATGAALVGRVAADHFAVVLPTVKGRSEAGRVFANLARACFGEPYLVESTELRVAAKAGLALFPNDGAVADALLGNAEAALRKAKETGERQVFYTADLIERTGMTLTLENKLRRALENEEFVLHYQPKVALEDRRIIGTEALIRWQSPELGLVPPMKFIPLMEETGMILEVGTWALKRASRDHRRWTESGLKPPRVAVNVSPIQLRQKDFVAAVEQAIMEGVAPTGIDLEITESLIMEDIEGNIGKLREVRGLGVGLAIDDFGTGYSSLSYLAKLPVQMLKIDRSFVITMLNEPDTMTLVQTIISLAHSLRLKVVAEGVDAEEQAKVLRLLRCDQMQGYLFSKPVPFDELTTLLRGS
ncbi:MAG TPA: PAS domain S-box protein, partial [Burkholderiales bacterium]|nr:PAS domain S-box protein [Burkholderiales bacterium]